ncbi:MAG TPA: uroporphyrinogen decarboxylase family protein [Candidatus Hydrogenedens sp.]|nr:uroporphyrinogen decarboxylase family protein [Candidatus Hydrogenedens sp.]
MKPSFMQYDTSYVGLSPQGENIKRMMFYDYPKWVPVQVFFLSACLTKYKTAINEIMEKHKRLFPQYDRVDENNPVEYKDFYVEGEVTDCWGCVWKNLHGGMVGKVAGHPLEHWDNFEEWKKHIPNPETDGILGPKDWDGIAKEIQKKKEQGLFSPDFALPHGFHFMLMWDLRGFENFMLDMLIGEPRLGELMEIIMQYNNYSVKKILDLGTPFLGLAEDLGIQNNLPVSKELWNRYVRPGYEITAGEAKKRSIPVYLHSDGHILPIIQDLIELGITLLNPQSRANGIQPLREHVFRKVAINLDLDRQLFPVAEKADIKKHIDEIFDAFYLPEGGLMLNIEINEDVPLNIMDYLFSLVEDYCGLPNPENTNFSKVGLF